MVASKTKIAVIAGTLILIGLGLTLYKTLALDFPLWPGEKRKVWTLESKIYFKPDQGPVEVTFKLPEGMAGWQVVEEHFASSGFGFSVVGEGSDRRARWTRESLDRPTTLYYKAQAYRESHKDLPKMPVRDIERPFLETDQQAAMDRLVGQLKQRSVDSLNFATQLIAEFNRKEVDQDVEFLIGTYSEGELWALLDVLAYAGIPAERLRGVFFEDGRRRQRIATLIEIYDGDQWQVLDPNSGQVGLPENFFVWQRGEAPILSVVGGQGSQLEFALVENTLPAKAVVRMEQNSQNHTLLDFTIYTLPVEQQGVFKGLLLIPVAALVVVLMRLIVGIKTSGTFMPILIALAFIQTTLWVGLLIFLLIVGAGLWIRSYLSHLNLLLVSRVASVVIVVILLMSTLAVISYKLGFDQVLTVTFFPTIILAWTIERMSILWEEEGGHEVLVQGGGSLLVAVLAYIAMSNSLVAHLTFNFPEIQLSLLGVIMLLGKYTGYRLSELYRFRDLDKQ